MINKKILKLVTLITPLSFIGACADGLIIAPTTDGGIIIKSQKKTPPRIRSFDYYPKTTVRKDDIITFTVDAYKSNSEPLQFTWKCSKGTLLSNSGNTVSWKPEKADGSLETGVATITVTVSDDNMTVDASANVFINPDGRVSNNYDPYYQPTPYPYPYYTPAPTYSPPPTTYYPSQPSPYYDSQTIFYENFENGYLDDRWNITYSGSIRSNNYLTWKKVQDDVRPNNSVATVTGPTDIILANTCTSEIKLTSQGINLRDVRLPRLKFEARSAANPASSVKLKVYWSPEAGRAQSLNVAFIADKNWNDVDVDLQNLLAQDGGSAGLLTISATVCNNNNEFKGPMIDNIRIYDASR